MRATAAGCAALMTMSKTAAGVATIEGERKVMEIDIKRNGSRPAAKGSPDWFTGSVRVDPLFQARIRRAPAPARSPSNPVLAPTGTRIRWARH